MTAVYTVPGTMIVLEEARVVGTLMEDNSRELTCGVIVASVHVVLLLLLLLSALLLEVVENTWLGMIVDSEIADDELADMSELDEVKVNNEIVEL